MRAALLLVLSLSFACGTTEGEALAEISWRFDYADPSDPGAPADIRDCSNVRANNPGPDYPTITKVRVALTDPEGMVQGIDIEHNCALGYDGKRVPIQGVVMQMYDMVLEAKSADGTVLYRYTEEDYNLEQKRAPDPTYTLETATGELHFFPRFNGSLTCPSGVVSFRTSMYRKEDGVVPETPTLVLDHEPACEMGASRELFVRGLPVILQNSIETFNNYLMVVEALGASDNTLHCGINRSRNVRLGDNSLGADEDLGPGTCPAI